MDNFTHLHGLVNRTAFTRYQRRQRLSKFRSDIQDAFRQGDKNALEAAKFLQANGRLDHALKLHYRAIPQGYEAFSARIARSAATERDEAEKPPYSYLYEGLKKRLGKPCEISKSFSELKCEKTGEIHRFTINSQTAELQPVFDYIFYLTEKFLLQSEARKILRVFRKIKGNGMSVPEYRVCDCGINPVTKSSGVSIISTSELERVRYKGLQTCGSVWHCPVCASRISYYRAREIRYMCDMWQKTGGGVIFITNTIRHGLGDDLRILLEVLFGIVWNRYINHRGYKTAREKLGYIGRVRAVEVTVGSNGWHPHVHEIWLIEKPLTSSELDDVKRQLYKVWNATLKHAGMKPVTPENGVTVQNGDNAAEYVSKFGTMPKWDMSTELTKSHMKRGRGNSMTPFDLLRASFAGDERASQLSLNML